MSPSPLHDHTGTSACTPPVGRPALVVAIPVRDEADHIEPCLRALDGQMGAQLDHVVLLLNNCTDASAARARATPMRAATRLHVVELELPPGRANAGHARRLAMEAALALAPEGILMTTDADGQVDTNWVAATLAAIDDGAEVVAGWAELDPADWGRLPLHLHEDDARECAYDALCDEIHARLDPDPWDPWPRHTQHSGASLAMTATAYRRCGGVPDVPSGEDRALVAALRVVDARIRHAPEVHVSVSGRTLGRAAGGMAETIRRRLDRPDSHLDDRLEPAVDCARRAQARSRLRRLFEGTEVDPLPLAHLLDLPDAAICARLSLQHFGRAWRELEAATLRLRRRLVAVEELPVEMAAALAILEELRQKRLPVQFASTS